AAVEPYPASATEDNSRKAQALTAWVTVPSADSFRSLAMKVLAEVLLSNAGSPLRKALIDSGLGSALADGSGLQDDYKESVFGADLERLEKARAEGRFFETLIRAELLDNPHRALLTAVPDTQLEERQRQAEMDRLAAIESRLTDAERKRIVEDALRLKAEQEA